MKNACHVVLIISLQYFLNHHSLNNDLRNNLHQIKIFLLVVSFVLLSFLSHYHNFEQCGSVFANLANTPILRDSILVLRRIIFPRWFSISVIVVVFRFKKKKEKVMFLFLICFCMCTFVYIVYIYFQYSSLQESSFFFFEKKMIRGFCCLGTLKGFSLRGFCCGDFLFFLVKRKFYYFLLTSFKI